MPNDSILLSTKELLGIPEEVVDFDPSIVFHINGAISTLRQLGVGPSEGFFIRGKEETFSDFLDQEPNLIGDARLYIFYKTKQGFDPPSSSVVLECLNSMIKECEWRLTVDADKREFFSEWG